MLALFNTWWRHKNAPDALFLARVVPIYKKGETDKASNYRPISLLSSFYKIYMVLIRTRIQSAIDHKLCPTQYGFRASRSTSCAIYIIRRIQDYAEMKGAKLNMCFLDWEKAFDKIQQDKMLIALQRLGFSQHYIDVIQSCYQNPCFFVRDDYGISGIKKQSSGIRQGCPLSPYLFVLVMSCVDYDVQARVTGHVKNNRLPGMQFDMVYYADDTVVFSQDTRGINELLKWTEQVSSKYGLKLNKDKCVAVAMNSDGGIHFQNKEPLKKEYEAIYLGNEINKEVNIALEISNKLHEVRKTWFKLFPYWKATGASQKWQIIVYDAVIRSKLLYGLETVQLTDAMYKKINAFQIRGLRKILKMGTTFINRANSNKAVYDKATRVAYPREGDQRVVLPFSEYHKKKKAKLLGHILRTDEDDPLRQVSFQPGTAYRVEYGKKGWET